MIRRWLAPMMLGLFCGLLAWHATLAIVPRALMALAVNRVARAGGINHMTHAALITAKSRAIVRPSPDLLYSSCPFDVAAAPVLVDVAPIDAPYWSLSIFDSRTNVAFVRNNREAGGKPVRVAIALAGQAVPPGYLPVRVDGRRGVALVRVLIDRTRPITAIDAARRAARCGVAG
ncbi:MAG: hypothetical protein B7Y45_10785 [Sphingomonas sp. 28-66-16]|nr:MAG: hypothetical protein B7Y45_10785 [Sphingomonas sp. 28-66-16]